MVRLNDYLFASFIIHPRSIVKLNKNQLMQNKVDVMYSQKKTAVPPEKRILKIGWSFSRQRRHLVTTFGSSKKNVMGGISGMRVWRRKTMMRN